MLNWRRDPDYERCMNELRSETEQLREQNARGRAFPTRSQPRQRALQGGGKDEPAQDNRSVVLSLKPGRKVFGPFEIKQGIGQGLQPRQRQGLDPGLLLGAEGAAAAL